EPHAKQLQFHRSNKQMKLYIGGNRSGKTVGGVTEGIWRASGTHPYRPELNERVPTQGRVIGVDFVNGVEKIIFPQYQQWLAPSMLRGGSWETAYDKVLRTLHFDNGSTIEFMSYDQDLDKFAGTSRDWVHFDEEPPLSIFNENRARLIDTDGDYWITMTPVEGMCVDAETEVFTSDGWKRYNDLRVGETKIMTHNGFHTLQGLYVDNEYEGELKTFPNLNTLFTPGHKWLTSEGLVPENELVKGDKLQLTIDGFNPHMAEYFSDALMEITGLV